MEKHGSENVPMIAEVGLTMLDGEPRVRDIELAERLGFDRPRVIRELIDRNIKEIEALGSSPCRTAVITAGEGRAERAREPQSAYRLSTPCDSRREGRGASVPAYLGSALSARNG